MNEALSKIITLDWSADACDDVHNWLVTESNKVFWSSEIFSRYAFTKSGILPI